MRYKADQKEQTRERIVAAAGRCFRRGGYNGVGVDGLAKEAGVTSGAFYGHFDSKAAAFSAAIEVGMNELSAGITQMRQAYGEQWWAEFARFYMGQKRTCDLADGCALQTLPPEIGRADDAMRAQFESQLLDVVNAAIHATNAGENTQEARDKAWASFAMLVGGVTLARAVADERLSDEIAAAIQHAVIALHQ